MVCSLGETQFRSEDKDRLKVKGQEEITHENSNQKKSWGRFLPTSGKYILGQKLLQKTKKKKEHYILIKGSRH